MTQTSSNGGGVWAERLREAAEDAVKAFKLLRVGMLDNKAAIAVIDAHVDELEYALARGKQS